MYSDLMYSDQNTLIVIALDLIFWEEKNVSSMNVRNAREVSKTIVAILRFALRGVLKAAAKPSDQRYQNIQSLSRVSVSRMEARETTLVTFTWTRPMAWELLKPSRCKLGLVISSSSTLWMTGRRESWIIGWVSLLNGQACECWVTENCWIIGWVSLYSGWTSELESEYLLSKYIWPGNLFFAAQ